MCEQIQKIMRIINQNDILIIFEEKIRKESNFDNAENMNSQLMRNMINDESAFFSDLLNGIISGTEYKNKCIELGDSFTSSKEEIESILDVFSNIMVEKSINELTNNNDSLKICKEEIMENLINRTNSKKDGFEKDCFENQLENANGVHTPYEEKPFVDHTQTHKKYPKTQRGIRRFANKNKEDGEYQYTLSTRRIGPFRYDLREILEKSTLDPSVQSSFLASLIAKASRTSIKDSKIYAREFVNEEGLTEEDYSRIISLLDRYSKYR